MLFSHNFLHTNFHFFYRRFISPFNFLPLLFSFYLSSIIACLLIFFSSFIPFFSSLLSLLFWFLSSVFHSFTHFDPPYFLLSFVPSFFSSPLDSFFFPHYIVPWLIPFVHPCFILSLFHSFIFTSFLFFLLILLSDFARSVPVFTIESNLAFPCVLFSPLALRMSKPLHRKASVAQFFIIQFWNTTTLNNSTETNSTWSCDQF